MKFIQFRKFENLKFQAMMLKFLVKAFKIPQIHPKRDSKFKITVNSSGKNCESPKII